MKAEKRSKILESILAITAGCLVLYAIFHNVWLLRAATAVVVLSLLFSKVAELIHSGWMLVAKALGWFNSKVLLSIVFFVILAPLAWLSRRFGTSSVQLKQKAKGDTYYEVRDHDYTKEDLEKLW